MREDLSLTNEEIRTKFGNEVDLWLCQQVAHAASLKTLNRVLEALKETVDCEQAEKLFDEVVDKLQVEPPIAKIGVRANQLNDRYELMGSDIEDLLEAQHIKTLNGILEGIDELAKDWVVYYDNMQFSDLLRQQWPVEKPKKTKNHRTLIDFKGYKVPEI
jgi:hypothetical protein